MLKSVEGRWGKCTYFAKDMYVGRSMHYYGEYNPDETEKILELANDLCLDIGANIGCISQALAVNGFKVVAFEPQTEVYKVLCQNFSGESHNVALGDDECWATMPKVYYSDKGNFGGLSVGGKSIYGTYKIPVRVLDRYTFDERVGFIKIDVEGYELKVLQGAVKLITKDKPILYIEDDRIEKSVELRKFIRDMGYTIEEHQPPLYRENNFFNHKKNVWDKLYASHNLICKPCS